MKYKIIFQIVIKVYNATGTFRLVQSNIINRGRGEGGGLWGRGEWVLPEILGRLCGPDCVRFSFLNLSPDQKSVTLVYFPPASLTLDLLLSVHDRERLSCIVLGKLDVRVRVGCREFISSSSSLVKYLLFLFFLGLVDDSLNQFKYVYTIDVCFMPSADTDGNETAYLNGCDTLGNGKLSCHTSEQ